MTRIMTGDARIYDRWLIGAPDGPMTNSSAKVWAHRAPRRMRHIAIEGKRMQPRSLSVLIGVVDKIAIVIGEMMHGMEMMKYA